MFMGRRAAAQKAHRSSATSVGDVVDLVTDEGVEVGDDQMEQRPGRPAGVGGAGQTAAAPGVVELVPEDVDEGLEHGPQLVGPGLRQPQVLADQGGGVGEPAVDGDEAEQTLHGAAHPGHRIVVVVDGGGQGLGPAAGVVANSATRSSSFDSKHAVEALERGPGGRHHLGDGEAPGHPSPT